MKTIGFITLLVFCLNASANILVLELFDPAHPKHDENVFWVVCAEKKNCDLFQTDNFFIDAVKENITSLIKNKKIVNMSFTNQRPF